MPQNPPPAKGPDDQACESCKFYQRVTANVSLPVGICRRYPPTASHARNVGGIVTDAFPRVSKSDWCGEFIAE